MANDTVPEADVVPEALTAAAELQELLLATENLEDFLQDLAVFAARSVAQGLSCEITLKRDGRPHTVANSDDRAMRCDEIQYGQGTGPCLDAMRTGEIVLVEDLVAEERWGEYRVSTRPSGSSWVRTGAMQTARSTCCARHPRTATSSCAPSQRRSSPP